MAVPRRATAPTRKGLASPRRGFAAIRVGPSERQELELTALISKPVGRPLAAGPRGPPRPTAAPTQISLGGRPHAVLRARAATLG